MKKIIFSIIIVLLATAAKAQVRVFVGRPLRPVVVARPAVAVRPAVVRPVIVQPARVAVVRPIVVRPVVRRRIVIIR